MVHQRSFFQRFGRHGICVLPAEVLSDDSLLPDPDTNEVMPSLRDTASADGLCYAKVLRLFAAGLYWAEVAATPDLADTRTVLLTEEHLAFALPWDVRLESKCPDHIHAILFAHARELQPARQLTCEVGAPAKPQELASSPVVLLEALHLTVLVTTDELQETIGFTAKDTSRDTNNTVVSRPMGSLRIQQAFLRVMIDNLMEQLYQARDQVSALLIKARCAIVALLQRWQRQTHQRVVNAVPAWCEERHCIVWHLQVGVPALASALAA